MSLRYERGLVFGCYDPLHYGHIRLFRACREHCQHLTVVVHDDTYIRRWKHREPAVPVGQRVDDVFDVATVGTVFVNDDRPRAEFVATIAADVVFLSEEVRPSRLDVGDGPEVMWMPRTPGISSGQLRDV